MTLSTKKNPISLNVLPITDLPYVCRYLTWAYWLFVIALSAKQERIEYISNDSNLISLTHRFLGLEPNDSTIDQFIRINKIGLNEFLQIKKGREIKYYV